jgi:hypothetical protein
MRLQQTCSATKFSEDYSRLMWPWPIACERELPQYFLTADMWLCLHPCLYVCLCVVVCLLGNLESINDTKTKIWRTTGDWPLYALIKPWIMFGWTLDEKEEKPSSSSFVGYCKLLPPSVISPLCYLCAICNLILCRRLWFEFFELPPAYMNVNIHNFNLI